MVDFWPFHHVCIFGEFVSKKTSCPRFRITNIKKKTHLKIECWEVIGLMYRWNLSVFWKCIKETPNILFFFAYSKSPLHVTFSWFFFVFFVKNTPKLPLVAKSAPTFLSLFPIDNPFLLFSDPRSYRWTILISISCFPVFFTFCTCDFAKNKIVVLEG